MKKKNKLVLAHFTVVSPKCRQYTICGCAFFFDSDNMADGFLDVKGGREQELYVLKFYCFHLLGKRHIAHMTTSNTYRAANRFESYLQLHSFTNEQQDRLRRRFCVFYEHYHSAPIVQSIHRRNLLPYEFLLHRFCQEEDIPNHRSSQTMGMREKEQLHLCIYEDVQAWITMNKLCQCANLYERSVCCWMSLVRLVNASFTRPA